ncbi:MAG: DUF3419 family protein [Pyrinomonadaceae bacterium]
MKPDQKLVLGAVQQKGVSAKQRVLQKLFAVWFDAFVYNQIWEDPRVDLQALQLNADSRILAISSGGCNALNYLLENPESVTAIDLNRQHIYLLRLKAAALKFLPDYESFFNLFGYGRHGNNVAKYEHFIAPHLDAETKSFWENNSFFGKYIYGKRVNYFGKTGLYENSRSAYFLRFFHKISAIFGSRFADILQAESPEQQKEFYEKSIAPFFDSFLIKALLKMPVTLFGLGVPPQQYEELKRDLTNENTLIDIYRERARRLACDFPVQENYFAWQAFGRRYDTKNRRAVPEYLKEKNHETLKRNINRLKTKIGSVTDEIRRNPRGAFNRFVFLDAQDWMNAETLTELWSAIAEKAEAGSRIIFRTASAFSPVESKLPKNLREKFIYEKEISAELFKQDRASIYGGFHLYILGELAANKHERTQKEKI